MVWGLVWFPPLVYWLLSNTPKLLPVMLSLEFAPSILYDKCKHVVFEALSYSCMRPKATSV
jgi:hypothetical protein